MRGEKGFALVLTLIVTALLVALTAEFVNEVYVDTSARRNFVDGQQASLMAESGLEAGKKLLQYGVAAQEYSSLADLERLALMLQIADEQGTIQVTCEEESGKLNINAIVDSFGKDTIYRPIAERLFKKLELQPELLDAVADWIDSDDDPRPDGAETPYYQALKPPYGAKNGSMETFEELRLVKGIDGKTLERLRPYLTVFPDDPNSPTSPININTAAKELLASLDEKMTDDLAERIIDYRKTTPLKTSTELGNKVSGMEALSLALASNNRIKQQEKGAVFRLISRAEVSETVRIIEAVVRVSSQGSQPTVLYWREH
ncbi:MAG: type II secretion system minor pseudopilin GspK [Geobacteraceae bacterium]|nr:type II secretion system minor pseudopilin GspK [Geobacteraceae bacterium]